MVSWTQLVMVVGVMILFLGSSVIPRAESIESIEQDSDLFIDAVFHDTLTDEVIEPPQSIDGFFLKYAFVWGTYEHRYKNYLLNFEIWNENITNLTIHVIGYKTSESCYVHIEAYYVDAQRHLGIIGAHSCCIFAFGFFGVEVYGIRQ